MRHYYSCISDMLIFLPDHQNRSEDSSERRLDTAVPTPTDNRTKEQQKKTSRGDKENSQSILQLQPLPSEAGEETHTRPVDISEEHQHYQANMQIKTSRHVIGDHAKRLSFTKLSTALIKAPNFLVCTKCDPIFKGWIGPRQAERRRLRRAETHGGCFRLLLLSERADGR